MDKLSKAGRCIKVWNLLIRHKERNITNTRLIRQEAKKTYITQALSNTLQSARHKLARAWKKYKRLKKSAARLMDEFLLNCMYGTLSES